MLKILKILFLSLLLFVSYRKVQVLAETLTLNVVADATINSASQNQNYGSQTILESQRQQPSGTLVYKQILLKFDLSTIPQAAVINSAIVKLPAGICSTDVDVAVYRPIRNWTENTVTFLNAPPSYSANVVKTLTRGDQAQAEWTITELVKDWLDGTYPNYGLYLINQAYNHYCFFYSKETPANISTAKPVLIVNYTVPQAADRTPPVISNILVNLTSNSSRVSWTTNESADSYVDVWPSGALRRSFGQAELVANHVVTISRLTPDTFYSYQIKTKDAAGNLATTLTTRFQTPPAYVSPVPNQTNLTISDITQNIGPTKATIAWKTNKTADSAVYYILGETSDKNKLFRDGKNVSNFNRTLAHIITLPNLGSMTTYSYIIASNGENDTNIQSQLRLFTTTLADSGQDQQDQTGEEPLPTDSQSPADSPNPSQSPLTEAEKQSLEEISGKPTATKIPPDILKLSGFTKPNIFSGAFGTLLKTFGLGLGILIILGAVTIPGLIILIIIFLVLRKKKTDLPETETKREEPDTKTTDTKEANDIQNPPVKTSQEESVTSPGLPLSKILLFGCGGCGCLIIIIIFILLMSSASFLPSL